MDNRNKSQKRYYRIYERVCCDNGVIEIGLI